jgi:hypothetical protein
MWDYGDKCAFLTIAQRMRDIGRYVEQLERVNPPDPLLKVYRAKWPDGTYLDE